MIQHPRRAVQTNDHTDNQKACRNDSKRVFVREPNGKYGGGKLPRRGVESVGEPVGDQGREGPFALVGADGIEVFCWERNCQIAVARLGEEGGGGRRRRQRGDLYCSICLLLQRQKRRTVFARHARREA